MSERTELTVILADGDPPRTTPPLEILHSADRIVCCDGAAALLAEYGLEVQIGVFSVKNKSVRSNGKSPYTSSVET